jgi:hypothetical protein
MADGELNPKLDFKNLDVGKSVKIKLDCAKAVKTGEGQWGTWHMWFGVVDGTLPVIDADKKVMKGYKGKVVFFPSKGLDKDLEKAANGNTEVEVKITKGAKQGQKGLLTVFTVEKLSEGHSFTSSPSSLLTEIEQSFVTELNKLIEDGYKITEAFAVKAGKQPDYQIPEERVKELYSLISK